MILLYYDKEYKSLARKLSDFLRSKKFEVWTENKNKEIDFKKAINKADLYLVIFSQKSNKSQKLIDFYDKISRKKPLILYVVSDLEYSLSMQNFLDSNYWIDGYTENFQNSTTELLNLINSLFSIENKPFKINIEAEKKQTTKTKENTKNKKNTIALVLVIFFSALIVYFIYIQNSNEKQNSLTSNHLITDSVSIISNQIIPNKKELFEEYLIGKWKLVDYNDSQLPLIPEDQRQQINAEIERLKKDFLLVLNKNHTFERYGFIPNSIDKGYWKADMQNKLLLMTPENMKDFSKADRLSIKKLTAQDLVLVISSLDNTGKQVITILTLKKVK